MSAAFILSETVSPDGLRLREYDRNGFVPIGAKPRFWAADFVEGNLLDTGTGDTAEQAIARLMAKVAWKAAA